MFTYYSEHCACRSRQNISLLIFSVPPVQSWITVCQSRRFAVSLTRCYWHWSASTPMAASTEISRQATFSSVLMAPSDLVGVHEQFDSPWVNNL